MDLTPEQKAHLKSVLGSMEEPAPADAAPPADPTVSTRRQLLNSGVEALTGTQETETARQLGIGAGPAPFEARLKSGLWPDKEDRKSVV